MKLKLGTVEGPTMKLKLGTIVRQVWQGWWEIVDCDTGKVLRRAGTREGLFT